jgi:hypothetical protein
VVSYSIRVTYVDLLPDSSLRSFVSSKLQDLTCGGCTVIPVPPQAVRVATVVLNLYGCIRAGKVGHTRASRSDVSRTARLDVRIFYPLVSTWGAQERWRENSGEL